MHLYVNGLDIGAINALPNFVKLGDNVRDVYVGIDAGPLEVISSVKIQTVGGVCFSAPPSRDLARTMALDRVSAVL